MTKHHEPTGITDEVANEAHDFLENTEAQEHKLHPDAQLDRGEHVEEEKKGLGGQDKSQEGQQKSKMDTIKEALHLKK